MALLKEVGCEKKEASAALRELEWKAGRSHEASGSP